MFCRRCGTQNPDTSAFCRSCGEPLNAAAPAGSRPAAPQFGSTPAAAQPKKNNDLILIGAAAAAVAVVVFLLFKLFFGGGGGSPERIAKKACDCVFDADAAGIVDLLPDEVVEVTMKERDMTRREMISELQDELDDQIKQMDRRYDNWKVTCKARETEDLSRREFQNLDDLYRYRFYIVVTEAKTVTIEATLKADGDTDRDTLDIVVIKVNGSWYLDISSMSGLV